MEKYDKNKINEKWNTGETLDGLKSEVCQFTKPDPPKSKLKQLDKQPKPPETWHCFICKTTVKYIYKEKHLDSLTHDRNEFKFVMEQLDV